MKAITDTIRFELDKRLNEIATIEVDDNGIWGVSTTSGYHTWGAIEYKSFDSAYRKLKEYEANCIKELKYQ